MAGYFVNPDESKDGGKNILTLAVKPELRVTFRSCTIGFSFNKSRWRSSRLSSQTKISESCDVKNNAELFYMT